MYRLARWAYRRGVIAERNRIKKIIAEQRRDKPEPRTFGSDRTKKPDNDFEIAVWHQVNHELARLVDPAYGVQYQQMSQPIPRIDEDL